MPFYPAWHIEWEVSAMNAMMWRIPNVNHLAPISVDMWQYWAFLTPKEIQARHANAIRGVSQRYL